MHENRLHIVAVCRVYHNITGSDGAFTNKIFKQNLIVIKDDSMITAVYIKLCNDYRKKQNTEHHANRWNNATQQNSKLWGPGWGLECIISIFLSLFCWILSMQNTDGVSYVVHEVRCREWKKLDSFEGPHHFVNGAF